MKGCGSVQWEYRKIYLDGDHRDGNDLDLLCEAGRAGWELIAVTASRVAYLKRSVSGGAFCHRIPQHS